MPETCALRNRNHQAYQVSTPRHAKLAVDASDVGTNRIPSPSERRASLYRRRLMAVMKAAMPTASDRTTAAIIAAGMRFYSASTRKSSVLRDLLLVVSTVRPDARV